MIQITRRGNGIARLTTALGKVAQAQTEAAAARLVTGARTRVPVQTGALRDSIEAHPAGLHAEVVQAGGGGHTRPDGQPVNYAAPVELGSAKRPAKPFLRPAAEEEATVFPREVRKALKDAL